MRRRDLIFTFCLSLFVFLLQGCIHDYPKPLKGSGGKGNDPTVISAAIEVSYDLSWENIIHHVEVSTGTKARNDKPHRFVIEVIQDGEVICQDIEYLSSGEFSLGRLSHKIKSNLKPEKYQVAVWYDLQDEAGEFPFTMETLHDVRLANYSTSDALALQCAFASDFLDLSDIEYGDQEITVTKELELSHPGARFEIITTDIQQFITNHHEAMLQGDYYTVYLSFTSATAVGFNLHSNTLHYGIKEPLELSGLMRLPFADYEELKIAEGFLFCNDEQDVDLKLSIKNSALVTISETDYFSFPIKPGYITTIYGDFLSNPIQGAFSINNIWDGEIVIEI